MNGFQPRPGQAQVLSYSRGRIGISAVPGSGKTITLAELAARLVAEEVGDGQEVLVVTLVNSAVDGFKRRINAAIKKRGLLPGFGYRVRTLHGLAHDIVRERPGLVDLSEDFGIIDEREAENIRQEAVEAWLRAHPDAADTYLASDLEERRADWVRRRPWPSLVRDVAGAFTKRAKDKELSPPSLLERLAAIEQEGAGVAQPPTLLLARLGAEVYAAYQRSLAYRGVVDFDDLIRLALTALRRDSDYLARLQHRWPYVLEDEAQDSSELQEQILRLLVGKQGNWVRVGDPNQAIYDTFTNANPRFLRSYLLETGVTPVELPQSGRSQQAIIDLANFLVDWTAQSHPTESARGAFLQQHIEPTGPGDPQPNPPVDSTAVKILGRDFAPEAELRFVVDALEGWHRAQEDMPPQRRSSCAVLTPRNERGFEVIDLLRRRGIPHVELLRSTSITRQTAGALGNLLSFLADPGSPRRLSVAFKVWQRDEREDVQAMDMVSRLAQRIAGCAAPEAYLWPRADHDWLSAGVPELSETELDMLTAFRQIACRWHRAAILPIDQLVLTLAGDLFRDPAELALAHKLAVLLRDVATAHPTYRLPELVEELALIARNERRFLGFADEDTGFAPPAGQVTVATMHKAKGLEWDRVYLMSVNNYNFPSGLAHDTYIAERWFVRDSLNLEAEALAMLAALSGPAGSSLGLPAEGEATQDARRDYIAERLRLLYVGITRARRELIVTWNTGRGRLRRQPAVPLVTLHEHLEQDSSQKADPDD